MQTQDPSFCRSQETHLSIKDRYHLMVRWGIAKKQTEVAFQIFDKIDLKPKLIRRGGEEHCILKGKFHQDDISVLNICATNSRAPEFIKRSTTTI